MAMLSQYYSTHYAEKNTSKLVLLLLLLLLLLFVTLCLFYQGFQDLDMQMQWDHYFEVSSYSHTVWEYISGRNTFGNHS